MGGRRPVWVWRAQLVDGGQPVLPAEVPYVLPAEVAARIGAETAPGLIDVATADVARDASEELFRALQPGYQEAFGGLGWALLAELRGRRANEP